MSYTQANIQTGRLFISTEPVELAPAGKITQFLKLSVSVTTLISFTDEVGLTNSLRVLATTPLTIPVGIVGRTTIRTAGGTGLAYFAYV